MYNHTFNSRPPFLDHASGYSTSPVNAAKKIFGATCSLMLPKEWPQEKHSSCTFVQLERTKTGPVWAPTQKVITCPFLTLCALLCTVFCHTSQALEKQLPYHMSPVAMLTGDLEVETSVDINKSLSIGPLYTNKDYEFPGENLNILGYGIRAEWRFLGTRSSGIYLSPFAKIWSFGFYTKSNNESFPSTSSSVDTTTYGALLGYQWMARSFSMNTGIGWAASNSRNSELKFTKQQHLISQSQTETNSFLIDLAIGWNF